MTIQETKEFIDWLLKRELEEEYRYQQDGGDEDKEYLVKLIQARKYIRNRNAKGWDRFITSYIVNDDVAKYLS